jgi:hypothetical protein
MSIHLCGIGDVGLADTCMNCGGSASLGGTQEPAWDGNGWPFCSTECLDEDGERKARKLEERRARCWTCEEQPGRCFTEGMPHAYERTGDR